MITQRLAIVLTVINLILLLCILMKAHPATAEGGAQVLRVRALEIVDENGKVRAQLKVFPVSTLKDGRKYPETTLLRLIDPNGRPAVKIGASADGSAISFAGDSEHREWSGVQILANGMGSTVKLTNKDGRELLLKP